MKYIGVDPDFDTTPIAVYDDERKTISLGVAKVSQTRKSVFHGLMIVRAFLPYGHLFSGGIAAIEAPEIKRNATWSKVDPADILGLREITGAVSLLAWQNGAKDVLCPSPLRWKGTQKAKEFEDLTKERVSKFGLTINWPADVTRAIEGHCWASIGLSLWAKEHQL